MTMSDAAAAGSVKAQGSRRNQGLPRVIAVDGPAASGKSTVGRRLSVLLGYPFVDTGAIYRAVTWAALRRGVDLSDEEALIELAASITLDVAPPAPESIEPSTIFVDGEDVTSSLRQPEVEAGVSLVSRVAGVRQALLQLQRDLAGRRAVVMAGRDIGTAVLPGADLKVYLDASVEERARRRFAELSAHGIKTTETEVLHDLRRRDRIDSERSASPLRPAEDAIVLDSDGLTLDEVVERLAEMVARS